MHGVTSLGAEGLELPGSGGYSIISMGMIPDFLRHCSCGEQSLPCKPGEHQGNQAMSYLYSRFLSNQSVVWGLEPNPNQGDPRNSQLNSIWR